MVTVIGLGFVGLTTALGFAEYGHKVYGIEINKERLATIQTGKVPFLEPGLDDALKRHLGNLFFPTEDLKTAITDSEYVYYCVGTPYGLDGKADLTYLYAALDQTLNAISDDLFRVLVVKSTIPPSTTLKQIIPFLKDRGVDIPNHIGVANNPEFLREGHCWEDFMHADRVVLGVNDKRTESMLRKLYAPCEAPVFAVSLNTGEFIKYLSNTSLACLISFANEMSVAADALGNIDIATAFRILHLDKRWQTGSIRDYFYPGCGYGGYCLPKDTNAFYALTRSAGFEGKILKEVIAMNDAMPRISAERILKVVGNETNTCIGILGLSFNPGSGDTRDTPSAKIIRDLNNRGYRNIIVWDPVAKEEFKTYYKLDYRCAGSYGQVIDEASVLVITTAWPVFKNLKQITKKKVVDCRYMF